MVNVERRCICFLLVYCCTVRRQSPDAAVWFKFLLAMRDTSQGTLLLCCWQSVVCPCAAAAAGGAGEAPVHGYGYGTVGILLLQQDGVLP